MSEVEGIDGRERRRRAEARLTASRSSREAAAAAHARDLIRDAAEGALGRTSLAEIAANPYRISEEERARILAMTEEEIEAAALADPDNPPWTDAELEQAVRERDPRQAAAKRSA